ncbi:MAG: hypothetical protein ACP5NQ_03690 [Vulcanisaeta sp.]
MYACGNCYIIGTIHVIPVNRESLSKIASCITHVVYEGVRDDVTTNWLMRNPKYLPLYIAYKLHFHFINKLIALLCRLLKMGRVRAEDDIGSVRAMFRERVNYVWGDYTLTQLLLRLNKSDAVLSWFLLTFILFAFALLMVFTPHSNPIIKIIYLTSLFLVVILFVGLPIRIIADKTLKLRNERAAEVAAQLIASGARVLIVFGRDHVRGIEEILRSRYGIECVKL